MRGAVGHSDFKTWSLGPGREVSTEMCLLYGVMEHWNIVEDPVSDEGRKGIQNCLSGGQGKTVFSKIRIHFEVLCPLLLQCSITPTLSSRIKKGGAR